VVLRQGRFCVSLMTFPALDHLDLLAQMVPVLDNEPVIGLGRPKRRTGLRECGDGLLVATRWLAHGQSGARPLRDCGDGLLVATRWLAHGQSGARPLRDCGDGPLVATRRLAHGQSGARPLRDCGDGLLVATSARRKSGAQRDSRCADRWAQALDQGANRMRATRSWPKAVRMARYIKPVAAMTAE